jgi:hypothetical protein
MVHHHRQHDRQSRRTFVVAQPPLPDAHDVAEQPEGHRPVEGRLVLEQHVDEDLLPCPRLDGVEKVRVRLRELLVPERAWNDRERLQIELGTHFGGQHELELAAREIGLLEGRLE